MATQNPIEQEGTYPLPEAQLDRFLLHVRIDYPGATAEQEILSLARQEASQQVNDYLSGSTEANELSNKLEDTEPLVSQEMLFNARKDVMNVHMATNLEQYLLELILTTRDPKAYGDDLVQWVQYGASPRASIALDRCARAHAWLAGRDYVDPEDIQTMAYDVLRHRVLLTYEAEADGVTPDSFVKELISRIAVP